MGLFIFLSSMFLPFLPFPNLAGRTIRRHAGAFGKCVAAVLLTGGCMRQTLTFS